MTWVCLRCDHPLGRRCCYLSQRVMWWCEQCAKKVPAKRGTETVVDTMEATATQRDEGRLVDLPCGCQDVVYRDGTVDREHDRVACSGALYGDVYAKMLDIRDDLAADDNAEQWERDEVDRVLGMVEAMCGRRAPSWTPHEL